MPGWGRWDGRRQRGFTLLEVMAALAVIAIALVVLLQTDSLNTSRALHARRMMEASQMARTHMEELFSHGLGGELEREGSTEGEGGVYGWSVSDAPSEFSGLREVKVTVTWQEGQREEAFSVLAYLLE